MVTASLFGTVSGNSSIYTIFPTNTTLNDIPYKELIAKWWIWNLGIPNEMHPLKQYPDTERCSAMQEGQVWFLPNAIPGSGKVDYLCNVPFGKVIMLPVSMTECESGGVEGILNDEELKDCAFNIATPLDQIEISLDGLKVNTSNLGTPIRTDFFNVTYPSNPIDIFGSVKPGTYRALAEGFVLFFHDLPVGKHNIHTSVVDVLEGKEFESPLPPIETNYEIFVQ